MAGDGRDDTGSVTAGMANGHGGNAGRSPIGTASKLAAYVTTAACTAIGAPTPALAVKYMENLDAKALIESSGDGSTFTQNLIENLMEPIVTKFMLPLAIVVVAWRSVYIAVFCVMGATDPLHVINEKNLSSIRRHGGVEIRAKRANKADETLESRSPTWSDFEAIDQEIAVRALKDELRKMARGLIVVMGIWVILEAIMRVVLFIFASVGV